MSQGHGIDDIPRLRMLFVGVLIGIGSSVLYGFSLLSEYMKDKYTFTQGDITTISTVGCCFIYLIFFSGMLFDYAGPKVVLPAAGALCFLGYVLVALAFSDVITSTDKNTMKILFCVFSAMFNYGGASLDVGILIPLMLNFPTDRGYMVMIQKTFCGLGTSILVALFNAWFRNVDDSAKTNYAGYAYFIGALALSVGCLGGYFINLPPYFPCEYRRHRLDADQLAEGKATLETYMHQRAPRRRLYIAFALVGVLLVFLTTTSIVTGYTQTTQTQYHIIAILVILLVASFGLIALPCKCIGPYKTASSNASLVLDAFGSSAPCTSIEEKACDDSKNAAPAPGSCHAANTMHSNMPTAPDSNDVHVNIESVACDDVSARAAQTDAAGHSESAADAKADNFCTEIQPKAAVVSSVGQPQIAGSFWSHLLSIDLWLLWISFFGVWGTGTTMIMNSAQLYRSKNNGVYDVSVNGLYVAIISVGSALGRISSGTIDIVLTKYQLKGKSAPLITAFFPVGSLLLLLAFLFFAVLPSEYLIIPFFLGAAGNGFGWGIGVLIMRMIYAEDIGKHYNFMFSAGFVSMIALNRVMFGGMFDQKANEYGTSPHCNHPDCVQRQSLILCGVNALTTLTAIVVHLRYRTFLRGEKTKKNLF